MSSQIVIAVVIPCYKVKRHIVQLIQEIPPSISRIYIIDDACPENTGRYVEETVSSQRIKVLYHPVNQGVGGAVLTGYQEAFKDGATVIVKLDGDGQMDPSLIGRFVRPILSGTADYTKGNRFYNPETLSNMPKIRILGNSVLSFINKLSSGYWSIMDPTNGYTAIHSNLIPLLPVKSIAHNYFFESDMLFRLNIIRAVVTDIPMESKYEDETSNLNILKIIVEFPKKYLSCFFKRIFYNYYLRDFNIGSIELIGSILLIATGSIYGIAHWTYSNRLGIESPSGVVMAAALPTLIGFQLLLAAINFDVSNTPKNCLHILIQKSE